MGDPPTNAAADGSFARYWPTVEGVLGRSPRHKSSAIQFSGQQPPGLDGVAMISALRQSLDGPIWRDPVTRTSGNWAWRASLPARRTSSPEVSLERDVVARGGHATWTFQMSTTSGFRGVHSDKRRAIDLVQKVGASSYRFIELKVESDNPLYAAFEILGYGLAYCLARHYGYSGTGTHNVMDGSRIELEVLAPEIWYEYRRYPSAPRLRFDMAWLSSAINTGLAREISVLSLNGLNEMKFSFRSFSSGHDLSLAAHELSGSPSS